jgi:hypothetical protein
MLWSGEVWERVGLLYILEMTLFDMKQLIEKKSHENVVNKHVNICVAGGGEVHFPRTPSRPSHDFCLHFNDDL